MVLIVGLIGLVAGLYIYQSGLGPHHSAGHLWAKVESTFDVSDEMGYEVRAVVILPDGTRGSVKARTVNEAQWLIDRACVEHRLRDDGTGFYRLAAPLKCQP